MTALEIPPTVLQVHGIWFYDEQELDKIASLLQRVKAGLPKPDVHPSSLQVSSVG